jgi:cell division protein FtsL
MSFKLQAGSLAGQVDANKKEFRKFAVYVQGFMRTTQQRFRDVQTAFAEALLNHETRIKEIEAKLAITPKQELQGELENLIVENAEISNQMDELNKRALSEKPVSPDVETQEINETDQPELPGMPEKPVEKQESKVLYHKEF